MQHVIFYTKEGCSLCDEAETLLSLFQSTYPYKLEKRDIYRNDDWLLEHQLQIPVIEVNGAQLNGEQINYQSVEILLREGEPYK